MKNIFLIFLFLMSFIDIYAQDPTVSFTCSSGSSCFSVDPCTGGYTYKATIDDAQWVNNGYTRNINWVVYPASAYLSDLGQGTDTYTVFWQNQPNSPARNIKVDVSYSKPGNTTATATPTPTTVTIKYIAPITQVNVSGATPASSTNQSSVSVPCGTQTVTMGVPTPATDPSTSVTYVWSLPAGWSGSSTSNSITATPNAGGTGTVTVSARRSDGSCYQNYNFSVTRPVVNNVTLSGNNSVLCPAGTTVQLNGGATNMTTWSWSSTGGITLTGANPSYPYKIASGSSKGTVTFTADNACQSPLSTTITIYAGAPTVEISTINGQPNYSFNYINNPATIVIGTNEPGVTYTYQILQGNGSIYYPNQNSGECNVYAYPFIRLEGRITNRCGSSAVVFYLQDQGNGFYKMASPNPATSVVKAKINAPAALKSMSLVSNSQASIVRTYAPDKATDKDTQRDSDDNVSFDVTKLPRGKYFLNFVFEGNKNFTEQLVLE